MAKSKKQSAKEFLRSLGGKSGQYLVTSELLQELMGVFGGPKAFAIKWFTEYEASKEGGLVRARMLDAVFRLFIHHTASLKGKEIPIESMSEQELSQAAKDILEEDGTNGD